MPTPTTSVYRLADQLFEGRLAERLATLRAEGKTWEQIARQLYIERNVDVTGVTVGRWAKALGIGTESEAVA